MNIEYQIFHSAPLPRYDILINSLKKLLMFFSATYPSIDTYYVVSNNNGEHYNRACNHNMAMCIMMAYHHCSGHPCESINHMDFGFALSNYHVCCACMKSECTYPQHAPLN